MRHHRPHQRPVETARRGDELAGEKTQANRHELARIFMAVADPATTTLPSDR